MQKNVPITIANIIPYSDSLYLVDAVRELLTKEDIPYNKPKPNIIGSVSY